MENRDKVEAIESALKEYIKKFNAGERRSLIALEFVRECEYIYQQYGDIEKRKRNQADCESFEQSQTERDSMTGITRRTETTEFARGVAASAWCQPMTSHIELDSVLADEFAKIVDTYIDAITLVVEKLEESRSKLQAQMLLPTQSHMRGDIQ